MPSTVIKSIDYESALSRLTVTFTTGRIYDYFAVPANVAEAFRASSSKGAYFNAHIRDAYPCKERKRILSSLGELAQRRKGAAGGLAAAGPAGEGYIDSGLDGGGSDGGGDGG
jgi:lysyl-tRNA synthetase class 2